MSRMSGGVRPRGPHAVSRIAARSSPGRLWIGRPPRRRRDHARKVGAAQHVVERGELTIEDFGQAALRTLEPILQIFVDRDLLVGRLEVAVGKTVCEVAELLDELRSKAYTVLTAPGGPQLDQRPLRGTELLLE